MAFVMPMFAALGTAAGASAATAGIAGLSIASGALGVVGALSSGQQASAAAKSEANMAEYNAKMAEIQSRQAYAAAGVQEDELRRRGRIAVGNQLAASAEAGAGLNGDLLRESVYGVEADSMAIRYEGDLKAQGLKDSAALQRSAASAALVAGNSRSLPRSRARLLTNCIVASVDRVTACNVFSEPWNCVPMSSTDLLNLTSAAPPTTADGATKVSSLGGFARCSTLERCCLEQVGRIGRLARHGRFRAHGSDGRGARLRPHRAGVFLDVKRRRSGAPHGPQRGHAVRRP
jgi:hypothetical protein